MNKIKFLYYTYFCVLYLSAFDCNLSWIYFSFLYCYLRVQINMNRVFNRICGNHKMLI